MRFNRTSRWIADPPKCVAPTVGTPEPPRWSRSQVRSNVAPCDYVGDAGFMLKGPLLLCTVQLSQLVDAGIEGVTAGLNVRGISEKLRVGGGDGFVAECHRIGTEPVQPSADVANKHHAAQRGQPGSTGEKALHFGLFSADAVPAKAPPTGPSPLPLSRRERGAFPCAAVPRAAFVPLLPWAIIGLPLRGGSLRFAGKEGGR